MWTADDDLRAGRTQLHLAGDLRADPGADGKEGDADESGSFRNDTIDDLVRFQVEQITFNDGRLIADLPYCRGQVKQA